MCVCVLAEGASRWGRDGVVAEMGVWGWGIPQDAPVEIAQMKRGLGRDRAQVSETAESATAV